MDIFKDLGISSKNTREHACFENGYLLQETASGIIKKKFPFETVSNEMYQESNGLLGEFTTKSKVIYTPYHWLPFCKGARVQMMSGELVVKDVIVEQDNKKAQADGLGIKGLRIVF